MNCKVKCTKEFNPGSSTAAGKTYEIVNGRITYDSGLQSDRQFESIEELNSYNRAQFKEIKKRGRPRKGDSNA